MPLTSWGGLPDIPQSVVDVAWADEVPAALNAAGLAVGLGRSYGDSGLASCGTVLGTRHMNRLLAFDREQGRLRCEAGVSLRQILELTLPCGWMLPVVPGTSFVTVGGAIANDIHGKNHHSAGSFGRHVREICLLRSSGELRRCSRERNADGFAATVAGLGLSGVILEAELQLLPVQGGWLDAENLRFESLEEFFALDAESRDHWEYTVAWIDCLSERTRGHYSRARHSPRSAPAESGNTLFSIPFRLPLSPVSGPGLRLFNSLYYHRQRRQRVTADSPLWSWLFPLDRIGHWNRLYGPRGFRQYQCVVSRAAIPELLTEIRRAGQGSVLAVLKSFGELPSPGLLSFPRPGVTLALDFPWRGADTEALFRRLDAVVAADGGAVYPAKDAHLAGEDFRRAYPEWERIEAYRDPALGSLFWQRVTGMPA